MSTRRLEILIVGAGAVGATYGHHLARGGARVSAYVRPAYAAEVREGLALFRHGSLGRLSAPRVERFRPHEVLTAPEEVAARRFDQIWLCVSSPALRGPWLAPFLAAAGEATVLCLQPGLEDAALLGAFVPPERLMRGLITLIAYQGPLQGERLPPPGAGIAFLLPPLAPLPLAGPTGPVRSAVEHLQAGGCPAVEVETPTLIRQSALGAGLMPLIAALECAGWSFETFRRGEWAALGCAAARQSIAIAAAHVGVEPPGGARALTPTALRALLAVAPLALPFDLETYLAYHFDKVGDQTRLMLDTVTASGRRLGCPTDQVERLRSRLPAR